MNIDVYSLHIKALEQKQNTSLIIIALELLFSPSILVFYIPMFHPFWSTHDYDFQGGITSSDLATKALEAQRAKVVGQALPGVPFWELGPESRHPGIPYIVFPGKAYLLYVCMDNR